MIHKTKRFEIHEIFFQTADRLFALKSYENIPLTTDREKPIIEPIKKLEISLVLCTNHIIRDVKFGFQKLGRKGYRKILVNNLSKHQRIDKLRNEIKFRIFENTFSKKNLTIILLC
jgi:hypothetical protein